MNARDEFIGIVLAGVGGQGLVTIGTILGEAAVLEGRNACLSSTYGTEARGTFTKCDVLIGDGEIDFIEVVEPDVLLCLAQTAFDRSTPRLEAEGAERILLLYDGDLGRAALPGKRRHPSRASRRPAFRARPTLRLWEPSSG